MDQKEVEQMVVVPQALRGVHLELHQRGRWPALHTDKVGRALQKRALEQGRELSSTLEEVEMRVEPSHMEMVNRQLEPQLEPPLQLEQVGLRAPLEEVRLQIQVELNLQERVRLLVLLVEDQQEVVVGLNG